jgi:2-oxoglutarate ferredoxin oxidoreductase subunit delta
MVPGDSKTTARAQAAGSESPPASAKAPKGYVVIDSERCKGCGFCAQYCPTGVLEMSSGFNRKGYHPPVVVRPEKCSGCDLCGMYCPDFAIYGVKRTDSGEGKT